MSSAACRVPLPRKDTVNTGTMDNPSQIQGYTSIHAINSYQWCTNSSKTAVATELFVVRPIAAEFQDERATCERRPGITRNTSQKSSRVCAGPHAVHDVPILPSADIHVLFAAAFQSDCSRAAARLRAVATGRATVTYAKELYHVKRKSDCRHYTQSADEGLLASPGAGHELGMRGVRRRAQP